MPKKMDHIAVVVENLEDGVAFWEGKLGLVGTGPTDVPQLGFRMMRYELENIWIAVCEPLGDESPPGAFLRSRGEGVYAIVLEVDDFDGTVSDLREKGVRLIGSEANRERAVIHPKDAHGLLLQLAPSQP